VPERLRFHLDEHISPDIAAGLRLYGIDVTTTVEAGLRTQSDTVQLAFGLKEKRVIVTHDADFLRLAASDMKHFGIAYCHKTVRSIGEIIEHLVLMYELLTPQEMLGRVEYL